MRITIEVNIKERAFSLSNENSEILLKYSCKNVERELTKRIYSIATLDEQVEQ